MARYKAGMLMNRLIKVTTENFVTLVMTLFILELNI